MEIKESIKRKAHEIFNRVVKIRRDIHKYPETALEEYRTTEYIQKRLEELELEIRVPQSGIGLSAVLYGGQPGRTFAIRADMDALAIEEKNEVEYKSQRRGFMHACGHDGHIAMALGAAEVLSSIKKSLRGRVVFIFQPAEEQYGGAKSMIEDGVLKNPPVDRIIALHLWPDIPFGSLGIKEGCIMASNDRFRIRVEGKSSHGAMPQLGRDALAVGIQIVNSIQYIVSREINPLDNAVITIGSFRAGTTYNIIAKEAIIEGTVRTTDGRVRNYIENKIKKIVEGICSVNEMGYSLEYIRQYPPTMNHGDVVESLSKTAIEFFGKERVIKLQRPYMTAEDFAYYLEEVPGSMCFLGTGEKDHPYPLHHEKFDFNEDILKIGVEFLARSAADYLKD